VVATTTSASDGTYSFKDLTVQQYTIEEVVQAGWTITQPTNPPGTYTLPPTSGTTSGLDFGNFQLVNVTGQVYNDRNSNGSNDGGTDPGLQGWTVNLLDQNRNIVATTTSALDGTYSFGSVGPGLYTIQEVNQAG